MFYLLSLLAGSITILYLLQESRTRIPPVQLHWTILLIIGAVICIYLAPEGFDRHQYREIFETPNLWGGEKDSGWESYNSVYRQFLGKNSDAFFSFMIASIPFSLFHLLAPLSGKDIDFIFCCYYSCRWDIMAEVRMCYAAGLRAR